MKHPSKWSKGEAGMVFISLPLLWGLVSALTYLVAAYGLVVIDVFAAVLSLTVGAILLHQHREAERKRSLDLIDERSRAECAAILGQGASSYYNLQPGEAVIPLNSGVYVKPKTDPPRPDECLSGIEHHNPFTLEPEQCDCAKTLCSPQVPRISLTTRLS